MRAKAIVALGLATGVGAAAGAAVAIRPHDEAGPADPYFVALDRILKAARVGTPRILIDLDRLDRNLETILAHIPDPSAYRIVEKSVPSVDLIRYISDRTGSRRIMAVHGPFLGVLLDAFDPGIDILLGKPMPVEAVEEVLDGLDRPMVERACREVQWLVDTPGRLDAYHVLAAARGLHLRISVEIDVGLHRGGARTPDELARILAAIAADPVHLELSGYMGYDGHVPHAPAILGSARDASLAAHRRSMERYAELVAAGRARFPALHHDGLVLNAGGSGSYSLYGSPWPVNDIGIGGAALRPSTYPDLFLFGLEPAIHIAAPVLKDLGPTRIPFLEGLTGALRLWDPNARHAFVVYGGGWAGRIVAPAGVRAEPLTTDPPNENLVPNESLLTASPRVAVGVGDFVFWYPVNSDALFQFEELLCVRRGEIVDTWRPFGRRY